MSLQSHIGRSPVSLPLLFVFVCLLSAYAEAGAAQETFMTANGQWEITVQVVKGKQESKGYIESGSGSTVTRIEGSVRAPREKYILIATVKVRNLQPIERTTNLAQFTLTLGKDSHPPFAYAQTGDLPIFREEGKRDAQLSLPAKGEKVLDLYFVALRDDQAVFLLFMDLKPIHIQRPSLPAPADAR